jgi:hypothetical protein
MTSELNPEARWSARIDSALRDAGTATPPEGLEGRVLIRLAAARMGADAHSDTAAPGTRRGLPRVVRPLLGFATAGLACAVIVTGSIHHSRHDKSGQIVQPPVIQMPGTGVGAASAIRPGAPASAPVAADSGARGRSARRAAHGRARIAPQSRKAPGVAVPDPPTGNPQN